MADDGGVKKVKVRFLRDEIYETDGRNLGKQFTSGRVYSMTEDQAGRWLRREAAELVEDSATAEEDGPPKPRRGRPPKVRTGPDDDADDDEEEDEVEEPAKPEPQRPSQPVRPPEIPVKPKEPEAPIRGAVHPSHAVPPAKATDKGR